MTLEPSKTAMVTLDLQNGILAMGDGYKNVIPNAAKLVGFARHKNYHIVHVGLGFEDGHPEVPDFDGPFLRAKKNNLFVKGCSSAEFHSAIYQPNDLLVYKQRISAFSENHLNLMLRARHRHSGSVWRFDRWCCLATVARAFDLDFRLTIIHDACFDADAEVHRVLTEKIFPKRGVVADTDGFIKQQA